MKRILIAVVAVAVVLGLLGGIYGYLEFTRTHDSMDEQSADFTLTALDLYNEFNTDEAAANTKFTDKIVQVRGEISKIDISSDTSATVLLAIPKDPMSNVKCELTSNAVPSIKEYEPGDAIILKGICTGGGKDDLMPFLDIEVARAVVIKIED